MRLRRPLVIALLLATAFATGLDAHAAEPFHVYAPSPSANQLWIVAARPTRDGLALTLAKKVDLGFAAAAIASHPKSPLLYVSVGGKKEGAGGGAVVSLHKSGSYLKHVAFTMEHGSAYLTTDRAGRFLLSANYGAGQVDVYPLSDAGTPGPAVAKLDEGRPHAHSALPSPDNRFVYVPYVKETNALFQYRFDGRTGSLTPLQPKDASPPAGTGPRHVAFHPRLPVAYFSNEQHLGVSVYGRARSGQLELRQVCDAVAADQPKDGVSSSDLVITPNGRFLFAGIRGHKRDFDWISRYRVLSNGALELIGLTPADKIPWRLALSPDGRFLMVTAFEGATLTAYRIGADGDLSKAGSLAWDEKISDLVTR